MTTIQCSGAANRTSNYLSRPDQLSGMIQNKKLALCQSGTAAAPPQAAAPESERPGVSTVRWTIASSFAQIALVWLHAAGSMQCYGVSVDGPRISFTRLWYVGCPGAIRTTKAFGRGMQRSWPGSLQRWAVALLRVADVRAV